MKQRQRHGTAGPLNYIQLEGVGFWQAGSFLAVGVLLVLPRFNAAIYALKVTSALIPIASRISCSREIATV